MFNISPQYEGARKKENILMILLFLEPYHYWVKYYVFVLRVVKSKDHAISEIKRV